MSWFLIIVAIYFIEIQVQPLMGMTIKLVLKCIRKSLISINLDKIRDPNDA